MIEIISLTDKGTALSKSIRRSQDRGWDVIYFLARMGGQSTRDKIANFCFGGNTAQANTVISNLKSKGIVVGG